MFYPSPRGLFEASLPEEFKIVQSKAIRASYLHNAVDYGVAYAESLTLVTPIHSVVLLNRIITTDDRVKVPADMALFWRSYSNWIASQILSKQNTETRMLNLWYAAIKTSDVNALEERHFVKLISMGVPNRVDKLPIPLEAKLSLMLVLVDAVETYSDEELIEMSTIPRIFLEKLLGLNPSPMPANSWMIV